MENEISLKLETRTVEMQIRPTRWKHIIGEPVFEFDPSVEKYWINKSKFSNLLKRLRNVNRL